MNTTVNPRMNISDLSRIPPSSLCELSCSISSMVEPEMTETYPGTKGRTHGERKETMPARNAPSGRGILSIDELERPVHYRVWWLYFDAPRAGLDTAHTKVEQE